MRDTLYDGRPFRTLNIIDEGNREGLRIECGSSISSLRLVRVMQELVEVYGKPEAIRLDNGPEMTSHTFVDWARDQGIRLMFIQPGQPNQNAFIERFNRSFRTEVLDACLFDSVDQVQAQADAWLTNSVPMNPWAMYRLRSTCPELSQPESLLLGCPLDGGVYADPS